MYPQSTSYRRPVKSTRHTLRRPAPFGAGILPPSPRPIRFEPSLADRIWAAQFLGGDAEATAKDIDEMAMEAEWQRLYEGGYLGPIPEFGRCANCGEPSTDLCNNGLCDRCDIYASEHSTNQRT